MDAGTTEKKLKKTTDPLVVWFRLYDGDKARVTALTGFRRGAHNALAYEGLMDLVARREAAASPIDPAVAKLVTEAQRKGVDVRACLRDALRTLTSATA